MLNRHNPEKARTLLARSGYRGERVILLVAKDYPARYNTAVAVAQQMKAVGINAVLPVTDWPTAMQRGPKGGTSTMRTMAEPSPPFHATGKKADAAFMEAFHDVANGDTIEVRRDRFACAADRHRVGDGAAVRHHAKGAGHPIERATRQSVLESAVV